MSAWRFLVVCPDGVSEPGVPANDAHPLIAVLASLDGKAVTFSRARNIFPAPKVGVICGYGSEELPPVVSELREVWRESYLLGLLSGGQSTPCGLDDLMCAPFSPCELRWRIQRALASRDPYLGAETEAEFKRRHGLESLLGESPAFLQVLRKIPVLAGVEAAVLLTGETGTGKELVARGMHYCGPRKGGPFIPVNCGALPESLLENELFGHRRGAYTGAVASELGLLAAAEGGSLFLDEVDTMSLPAQVKLLRFLQDREYRPLGGGAVRVADVRVLAASNTDLSRMVSGGSFREDLYYRLNVLSLHLPPLRERLSDLPVLARHFLITYRTQFRRPHLDFSQGAMAAITSYHWPGNVRELEGVVQRAALLAEGPLIHCADLGLPASLEPGDDAPAPFQEAKQKAVERFERQYLSELLGRFAGNITRAAMAAGKERRAFQRLIQKHGFSRLQFKPSASA